MLTKAVKSPHLNEAKPRMSVCVCVRLRVCVCVCLRVVYVCVLALRLVQTAFNEGAYGDKGVPPPTSPHPHPPCSVQPNPSPTSSSFHTHTHIHHPSLTYSFPSESYKEKTPHIRPIVETALFLNSPHHYHHHHPEEKIYNTITVSALLVTASILILKDG